jgi:DNA-binding NtrC family response regulator
MTAKNKKDINILVVDDEVELADTVRDYLSRAGYNVTSAYNGREALDKFHAGDFQLILTDIKMPEIDGLELLEAIKTIDDKVAVIVFTGYGTIKSAIKAIKAGAYDFIQKPMQMEKLPIIVDRAVEKVTLSKQLGVFKGMTLALLISIPVWLILGIIMAYVWK